MKALILVGGKATRLYPTTLIMPKQLIMIDGFPVIHYILDHCLKNSIDNVIICMSNSVSHTQFYNAIGTKYKNLKIDYAVSPVGYGTSGRILSARKYVKNESFVVYYGDIITTFDLSEMIQRHNKLNVKNNCLASIAVTNNTTLEQGLTKSEKKTSRIIEFIERPKIKAISDFSINVGISVCSNKVLNYCTNKGDFYKDTVPLMIKKREFLSKYDITDFIDIGTFSNIEKATKTIRKLNSSA